MDDDARRGGVMFGDEGNDAIGVLRAQRRFVIQLRLLEAARVTEVEGERHGNLSRQNQAAVFRAVERFFGKCLGGRVQEQAAPTIDQRLAALRENLNTLVQR
jgi:hypothetical protein